MGLMLRTLPPEERFRMMRYIFQQFWCAGRDIRAISEELDISYEICHRVCYNYDITQTEIKSRYGWNDRLISTESRLGRRPNQKDTSPNIKI